jgi:hypothetical protein
MLDKIKNIWSVIVLFVKANGIKSLLLVGIAIGLFWFGLPRLGYTVSGIFIGRNFEIIAKMYNDYLKKGIDGIINKVKDKFD